MALISWTNLRDMTDSIGLQYDRIKAAFGDWTSPGSGTVTKSAKANLTRVQTIAGTDAEAGADLLSGSLDHLKYIDKTSAAFPKLLENAVRVVNGHILARGASTNSFDKIAEANSARYYYSFADVVRAINITGATISAKYVFPPVTVLGTFTASGSGAGTFTDGTAIDTNLYGGSDLEAEVTSALGGSSISVTAVCTDVDGGTTNATGTINSSSGVGVKVNLTTANSKKVVDVTNITITGGAASNAFKVQTKLDRSLPTD